LLPSPPHLLPLFFFLLLPPPPISPLFPYTTLFRSVHLQHHRLRSARRLDRGRGDLGHHRRVSLQIPPDDLRRDLQRHLDDVHLGDRKSTRLNSSHVAISYAVFCLKKKKNKKHNIMI